MSGMEQVMSEIAGKRTFRAIMAALPVLILALAVTPCSVHAFSGAHEPSAAHSQPVSGPDSHDECIAQAVKPGVHHDAALAVAALPGAPDLAPPAPLRVSPAPLLEIRDPLIFYYPTHERSPPRAPRA